MAALAAPVGADRLSHGLGAPFLGFAAGDEVSGELLGGRRLPTGRCLALSGVVVRSEQLFGFGKIRALRIYAHTA